MAFEYLNLVKNTNDTYYVTDSRTNGASPSERKSNASNPNSAVNPTEKLVEDGNAVGDKLIRTTGGNKSITAIIDTESEPSVIGERIKKICEENGLDIKQLINGIDKITGLDTKEKRSKLSDKQRAMVLAFVECILKRVVNEHKHKNANVPILDGVLNQAYILTEYIIKGKSLDNLKDIDNNAENLSDEFLSAISNYKSDEELYAQIDAFEAKMKAEKEEFEKSIENLPEDERKQEKRAKFDNMASLIRNLVHARISVGSSNEVAVKTSSIVPSEDLGKRTNELYDMQSSDEGRKEIANKFHSFGLDQRIFAAYQARGEVFNQEAWEEYVQINTSWKDKENLTQYHTDVMTAANEGKLDNKVFKATTKGIGFGAQINHVMSAEEKTLFIDRWTSDIKNYYGADSEEYKEVKAYVEQKVNEYNKAQIEKLSAEPKAEKPSSTVQIPQSSQTRKNYTNPIELAGKSSKSYNDFLNIDRVSQPEYYQKTAIVREGILSKELKTITDIKEALGVSSDLEAIEFIAKDPRLKISEEKRIISYVRAQDIHNGNVETLAINVPSIMDLILPNIKSEYVQEFVNNVKMKIGYDQRKILEMKTKDKNKEAEGVA